MWYEWFFDGIGTNIIIFIAGIFIGGGAGYCFGVKNKTNKNKNQVRIPIKAKLEV